MAITLDRSGEEAILTLSGDVTLEHADEMRLALIKALIDNGIVILAFGSLTRVDLSCLQLLCSAHRSAVRMNKRFVFSGSWPELFKQCVEDAGYVRCSGCHRDMDNSCLWNAKSDCSVMNTGSERE